MNNIKVFSLFVLLFLILQFVFISTLYINNNNNDNNNNNNNNNKELYILKNDFIRKKLNVINNDDNNNNNFLKNQEEIEQNDYNILNKGLTGGNSGSEGGVGSSSSGSDSYPPPSPLPLNGTTNVTTTVYFRGGKSNCNSGSCSSGYSYSNSFACSYKPSVGITQGDWNKGIRHFWDPLPTDINLTQVVAVSFVIYGLVGCAVGSESDTTISFLIQNEHIGEPITTNKTDVCDCPNCYIDYEIPSQPIDMNYYNRSGLNKIQLSVDLNEICLSNLTIIFSYRPNSSPSPLPTPTPPNKKPDTLKKDLIISLSVIGGLLVLFGILFFIRLKIKKINNQKLGYTQIKDGKDIDIHQIKLGNRIGKGNFGEVFLGTWRGSQVAVKKLPAHNINENVLKEFHREIELMKNLRHPNVIQFLGSCSIPPDICICTEYMPRGSLYSILHDKSLKLSWDLITRMMIDAAKGVIYLHGSNPVILHRDLKSHNLLVDENWKVKVADFGLSTIERQGATMTACGTPCWTSPEVLRSQRYTEKADVYSFGIILWECATREDPYYGIPPFQVIFAVGREGLRPPLPTTGPIKYIQLIVDCLNENPTNRPTMEECLEILESIDTSGYQDILFVPQTPIN